MCGCVYIYVYVYVCMYVCMYIHTYMHTCIMYVYTRVILYLHIYAGAASLGMVERFARDLQPPTPAEGFGSVVVCVYTLNMDIQYLHVYVIYTYKMHIGLQRRRRVRHL
jgi:hypothetical protein